MELGQNLFEESGNILGFKVTRLHRVEWITMEVGFAAEIEGFDSFQAVETLDLVLGHSILMEL